MNWEEYQNTDFDRESHQSDIDTRSRQEIVRDEKIRLMRGCIDDIENHDYDKDGDFYNEETAMFERTLYVAVKKFELRSVGFLGCGDYRTVRMMVYDYDVSCINDEWSFAVIDKIVLEGSTESELQDALDATLEGYYELSFSNSMEYEDYDY